MQLGLCSTCYYAFKGERVSDKEDKSDYVDLEVTREEKMYFIGPIRTKNAFVERRHNQRMVRIILCDNVSY